MRGFLKKHWAVILICISIVACILNVVFAGVFYDAAPNVFTSISGWVSGIATIVLGCIAFWQNRQYKKDSDELMAKQYDYEVFKHIVDKRERFIDDIKSRLYQFCDRFNFRKITLLLAEMQVLFNENPNRPFNEANQVVYISQFSDELSIDYVDLKQMIADDWCKGPYTDDFIKIIDKYFVELSTDIANLNYTSIPDTIKAFNEKYSEIFLELQRLKNKYISWLDVDLNMILTTKSGDLDFIKKHYSYVKEQNNG